MENLEKTKGQVICPYCKQRPKSIKAFVNLTVKELTKKQFVSGCVFEFPNKECCVKCYRSFS